MSKDLSEDNPIITEDIITEDIVTEDIIEVETIIEIEKLIPANDIAEKKNAFEELLINKKNSDLLNLQIKNKGGGQNSAVGEPKILDVVSASSSSDSFHPHYAKVFVVKRSYYYQQN
ncbi:hypothetical protein RCL_jg22316.t1 [Rhizophagus clarus]|uniref:Uncharacterized protein n=1 Tax=Rhizophagus clarus TaxID=94130 RepID=A0A8H3L4Z3_9GLOM|nr:hypothetical protein RCL_jg22316.t1 [Rhizophagus clarus]